MAGQVFSRRLWVAVGLLGAGVVAFGWLWHRGREIEDPAYVWGTLMKSVSRSPDGDIDMYIPVSDHSSRYNLCEVSASLDQAGLKWLEPKPVGDREVSWTGRPMVVTAWISGTGRDGPVKYMDSGVSVRCPKCGVVRLLVRRDLALAHGFQRTEGRSPGR